MRYLSTLFVLFLQAAIGMTVSGQTTDIHGTWTAELRNGEVFLQVRTDAPPDADRPNNNWNGSGWSMGQTFPADQLTGLPVISGTPFTAASINFELRREAGTLAFDGAFRDGRGAGLFAFQPREQYVAEMKAIGYTDDLPLWRRFQLAVHDVGPRYIRDLKTEGYDKLTLDQVQRAKSHGVTIDYIRGIKAEGYKTATLEAMVRTRDHGVTQAYVQGMKKAGFSSATIEELVRARDHGVTPEYVQEIRGLGLTATTIDEFTRLRDHGVTGAFISELSAQGFKNLPIADVLRARDHGVSAEFIADMKQLGLKDLTLTEITRLRDHGITPGFVNHAQARGYKTTDPEELIRLKNGGLWK